MVLFCSTLREFTKLSTSSSLPDVGCLLPRVIGKIRVSVLRQTAGVILAPTARKAPRLLQVLALPRAGLSY